MYSTSLEYSDLLLVELSGLIGLYSGIKELADSLHPRLLRYLVIASVTARRYHPSYQLNLAIPE
jgi:hypothetical protein